MYNQKLSTFPIMAVFIFLPTAFHGSLICLELTGKYTIDLGLYRVTPIYRVYGSALQGCLSDLHFVVKTVQSVRTSFCFNEDEVFSKIS